MVELTKRQKQCMEALIQGKTNEQIGATVGIKAHSVEYHLSNVYEKMGLPNKNRVSAAVIYLTEKYREVVMQFGNAS